LKPKKNLLIYWLKMLIKSRELLYRNSHDSKIWISPLKTGAGLVPRSIRGAGSSGKCRLKEYYWFGSKKRYTYPVELKRGSYYLRKILW